MQEDLHMIMYVNLQNPSCHVFFRHVPLVLQGGLRKLSHQEAHHQMLGRRASAFAPVSVSESPESSRTAYDWTANRVKLTVRISRLCRFGP